MVPQMLVATTWHQKSPDLTSRIASLGCLHCACTPFLPCLYFLDLAPDIKKKKDKTLARLTKEKEKRTKIKTNYKWNRRYYKWYHINIKDHKGQQLYANKLDSLEWIGKFLETYNLLRLNQQEIENQNRQINVKVTESILKNLLMEKSPGPGGFAGEFY